MLTTLIQVVTTLVVLLSLGNTQTICPDISISSRNQVVRASAGDNVTIMCYRKCGLEYQWKFRVPICDYNSTSNLTNGTNIICPDVSVDLTLSNDGDCYDVSSSCDNFMSYHNFRLQITQISTELNGAIVSCGSFNSTTMNHHAEYYDDPFVLIVNEQEPVPTESSRPTTTCETVDPTSTVTVTEILLTTTTQSMTHTGLSTLRPTPTPPVQESPTPSACYTTQPSCDCSSKTSTSSAAQPPPPSNTVTTSPPSVSSTDVAPTETDSATPSAGSILSPGASIATIAILPVLIVVIVILVVVIVFIGIRCTLRQPRKQDVEEVAPPANGLQQEQHILPVQPQEDPEQEGHYVNPGVD